jgi:hypothetical protein
MTRVPNDSSFDDVEELRRRFEEFRSRHRVRAPLPEELRRATAEMATRRGMNFTARSLRLDTNSLKKWMGARAGQAEPTRARRKLTAAATPTFLEPIAPTAGGPANCTMEVEARRGGKLRLEWRAVSTTELSELIRAFVSR